MWFDSLIEENILYPTIDRMLTPQEIKSIFEKMENLPEEAYTACCGGH